jgi:Neuraminidase (sialidase)
MRISVVAAVTGAALAAFAPAAFATHYTAGPSVVASPTVSPFMDPCVYQGETDTQTNFKNTEVEPQVAVNPTDPSNVIGVFQQDRWSDGGAHGLTAASSLDSGSNYFTSWAEFSACSDKPETPNFEHLERATDPWVSFDSAGRAYQIGLPITDGSLVGESAVTTSYSDDGGIHWSPPVDVTRQDDPAGAIFLDKQSITADPYHPNRAWATWIQGNLPGENISFSKLSHAFSYRGTPMVARTTDGGQSWSTPKPMTNANLYAQGNQIVVLPDGTLVDIQAILFKGSGVQPNLNGLYMAVMRSKDGGVHWSSPTKVAPIRTVGVAADGQPLRVGDYLPDLTVDPQSGDLFATWADGMGGATNKIVLSRSTDGGQHWSTPRIVSHNNTAQSFNHAVAVGNDGELAVLYYDDARNDESTTSDGIPTDVYLRHSGNAGNTWSAPQKLASFDMANAPIARGYFVGDYQGLSPIGADGLLAFFGVTDTTPESANVLSINLQP